MLTIKKYTNVIDQLADMLKAYYPLIYLTTYEYDRAIQKLRKVAKSVNTDYKFYEWNCVEGLGQRSLSDGSITILDNMDDPEEVLRHIESQIEIDNSEIFILEDFHEFIDETNVKLRLRKLAEKLRFYKKHIVIVSSVLVLPPELEKYITVVELPLPGPEDLQLVLERVAKDSDAEIDDDLKKRLIDSALGMTEMEADQAYCLAAVKSNFNFDSPKIVAFEKEQIIKKSGVLDYFQEDESLKDIGGLENLKEWLTIRKQAFNYSAQKWGLSEPKGLMLIGVPGCGKSLSAKCIASLWNIPLLKFDLGKVFQAEVGSSENNVRRAINTAEAVAPCVLWIDEIEKGLSGIKNSGSSDGGTSSRIFSTILTWMQEKTEPVFVVATANDISNLPPELLRKGRFDEIFFVDLPSEDERKQIFSIHLSKKGHDPKKFGLDKLAHESKGFNGAEIEECVKEAMYAAYFTKPDSPDLQIIHLLNAIKGMIPLSRTMRDHVDNLRKWAGTRSKLASAPNNEVLTEGTSLPLTKVEKEINRSFD